jgi:hypothetical protein
VLHYLLADLALRKSLEVRVSPPCSLSPPSYVHLYPRTWSLRVTGCQGNHKERLCLRWQ